MPPLTAALELRGGRARPAAVSGRMGYIVLRPEEQELEPPGGSPEDSVRRVVGTVEYA